MKPSFREHGLRYAETAGAPPRPLEGDQTPSDQRLQSTSQDVCLYILRLSKYVCSSLCDPVCLNSVRTQMPHILARAPCRIRPLVWPIPGVQSRRSEDSDCVSEIADNRQRRTHQTKSLTDGEFSHHTASTRTYRNHNHVDRECHSGLLDSTESSPLIRYLDLKWESSDPSSTRVFSIGAKSRIYIHVIRPCFSYSPCMPRSLGYEGNHELRTGHISWYSTRRA